MATSNQLLYTQDFTGTTFTVTHNLDRLNLDYRVVCSGSSRPDLVQTILFPTGNERNSFDIYLTSYNVGVLQVLDTTKYPVNLPTPENSLKLIELPKAAQIIDSYVTGATLNSTTLELGRNQGLSAVTADLASIDTNSYVTGVTLNSTTLEIERNDGLADVTVDLAPILGPLKIINLTSTDNTSTFGISTPLICPWNVETYKDAGFTHSNSTNNTRITIVDDGTYQIAASISIYDGTNQRTQTVSRILINGVIQSQPYGSSYIRNSGNASNYWSCVVNPPPIKLSSGDYVEVQIQLESEFTPSYTPTFSGASSSFSIINLNGIKGADGPSGTVTNNSGMRSDSYSGLTTTATFHGDGTDLGLQHDRQTVVMTTSDSTNNGSGYEDITELTIDTGNLGTNGDYIITLTTKWKNSVKKNMNYFMIYCGSDITTSEVSSYTEHDLNGSNEYWTTTTQCMVSDVSSGTTIKARFKDVQGTGGTGGVLTVDNGTLTIDGIRTTNNIS